MRPDRVVQEQPAELRDYVSVVRAHWRSILAIVLAFTMLGVAYAKSRPAQYRATARVLVLQSATGPIGQASSGGAQGKPINLETEAELVPSSAVASIAKASMRSPKSPQQLAGQVDASFTTDSQVLVIGFTAGSPAAARAGAQAFADAYLAYKTAQMDASLKQMQATLDARLAALNKKLDDADATIASHPATSQASRDARNQKALALQQIADVQKQNAGLGSFTVDPGTVVGQATLPTNPVGSSLTYAVVGLLLGVAVGFGQAFFRDALDRRLTGIGDLEEVLGAPVKAVIPRRKGKRSAEDGIVFLQQPTDGASEGYRTLRTGLLFAAAGDNGRTVVVTSASEGEGKSTTAVNLAVALAQANVPVALIDADLRRPALHRFFKAPMAPGLIELLRGEIDLNSALTDVGIPRLRFIPSGDVSPGAPELFSPPDLAVFFGRLKEIGTMVIVDTPPLIVSDPLALAPYVDGVLVVADSTSVTADALAPLIERLRLVGGRVIGGVLNKYDPKTARGYASEYGYGTYGQAVYAEKPAAPKKLKSELRPTPQARAKSPATRGSENGF